MRTLLKSEANEILLTMGLEVSDWGGVSAFDNCPSSIKTFKPSKKALELYVTSMHLSKWLAASEYLLIQADNSTFPSADEILVLKVILGPLVDEWLSASNRSLLIEENSGSSLCADAEMVALVIYFSIIFEWHICLVSGRKGVGARLGIQDGVVSFYGDKILIEKANSIIRNSSVRPLML